MLDLTNPVEIRLYWMRKTGIPEEDIQESLQQDPPTLIEELKQLRAMEWMDEHGSEIIGKLKKTMRAIYLENGLPEDTTGYMVCISCRKLVRHNDDGSSECSCQKHILME